ncbi:tyrosine-protein kinase CSK-like isoform X2 [Watersipora subatra]|uniref:tyrosine-protein kinase CSK-like isoform X2 n=1 Tax=Watersipora subatra TaxID=2589382 RepID=UPI00355C79F9
MSQPKKVGPWQPGTEVMALYNFDPNSPEDLPFRRRDILIIVKATRDPNWYIAKKVDGKEGMIPANYVRERAEVKLNTMPWFHGKMKREEAEDILKPRQTGLFLVRESNNFPGDYTLCVVSEENTVEHYHILYENNKLTLDNEVYFENLIPLVEHYLNDADGLCCKLETPLPKKGGALEGFVDWKQFEDSGWVLQKKDLQKEEIIGQGEFGDVYKGVYRGTPVAIKSLKEMTRAAQTFLREAQLMTELQHPNLVLLMGVMNDADNILIITEYLSKGNLVDYLRTRGRSVITKVDQINFACDVCKGMAYLEEKKLVHRDLAARNILIHENGMAKVSDFGLARHADMFQDGGKFPIKWTAPEALRNNTFTSKSDVWSFGVLLWELYSFGRNPYPRIPQGDVMALVEKGYRMESPESCPREIFTIMSDCWSLDAKARPDFRILLPKFEKLRTTTV